MQLDFSTAFDMVNHLGFLNRLRSVADGGSELSVMSEFLTDRSQDVTVDSVRSELGDYLSGVPQGSALAPLLFLLYTSELFHILENDLHGYSDDSTLIAVAPTPRCQVFCCSVTGSCSG